ncbi:PREDICTED: U3 small nucleolar RNA-associated protein 15 homolog [Ceratosolen solmsi marchali]|uniref:U3 small nucleolar RNA-associated protein 15 homolog n=1 Tax=Ceratosolen solmsi marchali TaxID=326594 RepID=A0AAJ6YQN1_9HYME|nr:PREDICTED: U3 small nucleolar RNA-associated protein 15 homolog [Ceratosolen solmsi marchali]
MSNGMISIRQREKDIKKKLLNQKKLSYRYTGASLHCIDFDMYVHEVPKEVMGKHDTCLRKFQYSKALDYVLMNYIVKKSPHTTVALFQELIRRQGIIQALAGRNGKSLVHILRFIIRQIGNIRFGRVLLHIANTIMDIYGDRLDELNLESQVMFEHLAQKLKEEQALILSLIELQGSLEMMLSAAETIIIPEVKHLYNFAPSITAQKHIILNINYKKIQKV